MNRRVPFRSGALAAEPLAAIHVRSLFRRRSECSLPRQRDLPQRGRRSTASGQPSYAWGGWCTSSKSDLRARLRSTNRLSRSAGCAADASHSFSSDVCAHQRTEWCRQPSQQIAEVRAELKSLGLDSGGQKPEVSKRMLEFVYSLSAEDKATVGLKVRWVLISSAPTCDQPCPRGGVLSSNLV